MILAGKLDGSYRWPCDDDGNYRAMLQSVAGVRSAADLDEAVRRAVLEHLRAGGAEFRPARKSGLRRNRTAPPPETERQVRKIRAMLAEDGRPDAYAEASGSGCARTSTAFRCNGRTASSSAR